MRHEVGDRVKIRPDLDVDYVYSMDDTDSRLVATPEMLKFSGMDATIVRICKLGLNRPFYNIDIDNDRWQWLDEMFELDVDIDPQDFLNALGLKEATNNFVRGERRELA